ncbi:MAG TPA: hypothetical protein DC000_06000 [Clostridiales bacterium]|nr:hypothetical protein [Clostridiales bacterium]
MLFGGKKRVEEDLDKIRFANLSTEKQEEELAEKEKKKKKIESIQFEKNDRLALIIATFSIVLPYVFTFFVVIGAVIGLLYIFLLK